MEKRKTYFSSTRIAVLAVFSALAGVLQCFSISMPLLFASWLELNFSDIPALIGTFALGPLSGAIIVVMRVLIRVMFRGTSTMFVGDLADIIIGLALVLPAGIIYKKHRTFKGALVSIGVGTACSVAFAVLANWLILIPFYVKFMFNGNMDILVGMLQSTIPAVTKENFYIFYLFVSVLPFNVMRCLIAVLVTLPVYKHISRLINRIADRVEGKPSAGESGEGERVVSRQFIITVAVCATLCALIVLLALLRGFEVI